MCGSNTTNNKSFLTNLALKGAAAVALTGFIAVPAAAQMEGVLEEIVVTAQKREEALQDVPISVATVQSEKLNMMFSGSEDILALSGRVPGLYAESSNGRSAPRFYMRGLGNIDFDLAASQPVSLIMDEVVMENVVLKSFPLFDVNNIEVIRGPQGTLFGRNTTAGIVKVNTARPSDETSGYVKGTYGTYGTANIEGAVGGSLGDTFSARVSALYRTRDNWITNGHTGEESLGEYSDAAVRLQMLWEPTDRFSGLLSFQTRSLEGTSSIFRANVFTTGSADLNQNYTRDLVYYDGGDNNPQEYDSNGVTLNLTWDFDDASFNSITSFQDADGFSRGDIDGGVVDFSQSQTPPDGVPSADIEIFCPFDCTPVRTWPGEIWTPSVTQDGADTNQFTQEFRLASDGEGPFNWQIGAFYFDSELTVTTESFASFVDGLPQQDTIIEQKNKAWAVFGQGSYDVTDKLTLTAGVRYTDDEQDFQVLQYGQLWLDLPFLGDVDPINVRDDQTSWELSANYVMDGGQSLYGRVSSGFRAQTIQGRDVSFLELPSVADSETIMSYEAGYKADLLDNRLRLNIGVFAYEVDDMQLSIIGGESNSNQVVNADKGEAVGFEIDFQWLMTDNLLVSGGYAYNDTELKDPTLSTAPCGSGLCTSLDPREDPDDPDNPNVLVNGNPFPRAPESTFNFELRYGIEIGNDSELYFLTDWVWYGAINMPLYEAEEFKTDGQYEGGLRVGYMNHGSGWGIAAYGRNITDEDNVLGFIDFSNNTGFVNEPTIWGLEASYEFGD
jgi:iron complex outermembrane receptor protein